MNRFRKTLTFVAGLAVAFGLVVAPNAEALTASQLSAILEAAGVEQSIIDAVVLAMGTSAPSTPASTFTFTRDLTVGSTGNDVQELQQFLNSRGHTVAASGPGSPGQESMYFGPLTRTALAAYQAANGISPAVGYFGPITRANLNQQVAVAPGTPTTPAPGTPTTPAPGLSGSAGNIQAVTAISTGVDSDVPEGATRNVLGFEVEADSGSDLALTSVRLTFDPTGSNANNRLDRYATEVEIKQGSTVVGTANVSSFSRNSANLHTGTVSLSNVVVRSGEKVRFHVAVRAANVVDSQDAQNQNWRVALSSIRYNDASGAILSEVFTTPTTGVSGNIFRTFSIESASDADGARLQASPSNPTTSHIQVETNNRSDYERVFAFRLRGDAGSSNIDVRNVPVVVRLAHPGATAAMTSVIDDIRLQVGNTVYDNVTWGTDTNPTASTTQNTATFAIDEGDLRVASNQNVDVVLYIRFNQTAGNYDAGTSVRAEVSRTAIGVENNMGSSLTLAGANTVEGEWHNLLLEGAAVVKVSESVSKVDADGENLNITLVMDVTAVGNNVVINRNLATSTGASTANNITYTVGGNASVDDAATVTSNASFATPNYTIFEGETRRVTLTVNVNNANPGGFTWIEVNTVAGTAVTNVDSSPTVIVQ